MQKMLSARRDRALRRAASRKPSPGPEQKTETDEALVARLDALIRNARATWFSLLALLLFDGITLANVRHIDFYGVDRSTQLPVLNIGVPTHVFFYAAPILTAAAYGYFHLYLIRLWETLGPAPDRIGPQRLGDRIAPWLVTDAALHLRARLRPDDSAAKRPFEAAAMALNFLLAWGFGTIILGFFWWGSMPARDWRMTGVSAATLLAVLVVGYVSFRTMWARMKYPGADDIDYLSKERTLLVSTSFIAIALGVVTFFRTCDTGFFPLARVAMPNAALVERPDGWLPYQTARADHYDIWCKSRTEICANAADGFPEAFLQDWKIRRDGALAEQRKPRWHEDGSRKPNLSSADLRGIYLSGANLRSANFSYAILFGAQMEGADLGRAQLEQAYLREAQMEGVNLSEARMERADLRRAHMEGAILWAAYLEKADFRNAQMSRADLKWTNLKRADLSFAQMDRVDFYKAQMKEARLVGAVLEKALLAGAEMKQANLTGAQMKGAVLSGVEMEEAVLREAQMQGADLIVAQMKGVDLSFSSLMGDQQSILKLPGTNLSAAINSGGALRFANLTGADFDKLSDFRNSFGDGSVKLPSGFREAQGGLCQWPGNGTAVLSDAEFFGRWKGWLLHPSNPHEDEASAFILQGKNQALREAEPIPPDDPTCVWKTGPMVPGTDQPGSP